MIGGGASGMMAALVAGERGRRVLLLEKNSALGEKLKITGGGRCNITNAEPDARKFLQKYGKAEAYLYSPFSQFSNQDTFKFFEARGLPLVVQARQRAFPQTERAVDVCKMFIKALQKQQVIVKTNCQVRKIIAGEGSVSEVVTNQGNFSAKSYVLATGGLSHQETGATGDGFAFLRALGHTVTEPTPSIVPLQVSDEWVKMLAGISLSFAKITFFLEGEKQFSKTGKILFTHFGLSGPTILNSASQVADLLRSGQVRARLDLYPQTDLGSLETRVIKIFDANKNKNLRTIIKEFVPAGLAKAIAMIIEIDLDKKVHSVTREERKQIVRQLRALPMTITGLMGFERAVVADGGVSLDEVDLKTMCSKKYSNLYVTGDLLNINRPSGGYSLQLCWTMGYIAGNQA